MGWQLACMLIDQGSIPIEFFFQLEDVFCLSLSFFFVTTSVTKVTEHLCSGGFFLQTNFGILTSHF